MGIVLVVAAPVLAVTGRSAAVLAAVLALHLLLRARRSHGALLVAAELGCGSLALAGVTVVLLATDPVAREVSAPALVLAVAGVDVRPGERAAYGEPAGDAGVVRAAPPELSMDQV